MRFNGLAPQYTCTYRSKSLVKGIVFSKLIRNWLISCQKNQYICYDILPNIFRDCSRNKFKVCGTLVYQITQRIRSAIISKAFFKTWHRH